MNLLPRNPEDLPIPVGGYSQAVELSDFNTLLFISGQIAETPAGEIPPRFEEQCEMIWNHILNLLQASNLTLQHIVKINTYLTDRSQVEMNQVIRDRFLKDHRPALTVIIAQTLETRWLLEIDAVAAK